MSLFVKGIGRTVRPSVQWGMWSSSGPLDTGTFLERWVNWLIKHERAPPNLRWWGLLTNSRALPLPPPHSTCTSHCHEVNPVCLWGSTERRRVTWFLPSLLTVQRSSLTNTREEWEYLHNIIKHIYHIINIIKNFTNTNCVNTTIHCWRS